MTTCCPTCEKAGVTPIVKTIDADPNDTATTGTQAPLVIQALRSAGVTSIIPLMPFNVFYPVLQAETAQQYFPRLLLSDYESSILASLGLIPIPYAGALNGQEGVTTETLGGIDDDRPQSQGGYDPGVHACWTVWHKAYPQVPPGNMNDFIEEQGPVVGWCQAIRLFWTTAEAAGPDLNRRSFVTAMSKIKDFPGAWSPVLTYGPDKRYGPTQYQVVNSTSTFRRRRSASQGSASRPRRRAGSRSRRGDPCPPADGWTGPATVLGHLTSVGIHAAVNLHIDASPDKVWGLVSDITRMGEYSPGGDRGGVDGAVPPARRSVPGTGAM